MSTRIFYPKTLDRGGPVSYTEPVQPEITVSWHEIQAFLAGNPGPGARRKLTIGEMRHSMGMPRYFLDRAFTFDGARFRQLETLCVQHGLRQDIREVPGPDGKGNIVLNDKDGTYLGRLTTVGLTLTPQRFTESLFTAIVSLYFDHA